MVAVYAPEDGKLDDSRTFYESLQKVIDHCNQNGQLILLGDFSERIGNVPIPRIVGIFVESTCNDNRKLLKDFASFSRLKLIKYFIQEKDIRKYTWSAQGHRSLIDYVIVNDKLERTEDVILDQTTF